jgi:aminoglycoside 2'-N-acetyltransferase I
MDALERVIRRAYDVGALGASAMAAPWYASRGWRLWQGRCLALTPKGIIHTPEEEDCVYVLPLGAPLDLTGELTCDWRDGDVW